MKLVIKSTCVVANGKIAERGAVIDTGDVEPTADKLAYQLISAGRAVQDNDPEAKEILAAVVQEKAIAKKAAKDDDK